MVSGANLRKKTLENRRYHKNNLYFCNWIEATLSKDVLKIRGVMSSSCVIKA